MEDYDPFDDLSVAEDASFAKAAVRHHRWYDGELSLPDCSFKQPCVLGAPA